MAALTAAAVPSLAQVQRISANIHGGGGNGKCTFEVEVDGAAEVQIRGSEGFLRTVSGAPARWIRLDCNQPMPDRPSNFRFRGIDGRGRQRLVRDPNRSGGAAVVLVEDRHIGRERYTGDITWRGGYDAPWAGRDRNYGQARRISKREAIDTCSAEVAGRYRVERRRINLEGASENRDGVFNMRFDFVGPGRELNRGVCSVESNGNILDLRLDGERGYR